MRRFPAVALEEHGEVRIAVVAMRPTGAAAMEDGAREIVSVRDPAEKTADGVLGALVDSTGFHRDGLSR